MMRNREERQGIYYTRVKRVTNDLDAELERAHDTYDND
jgi:hypothetical protein